MQTCTLCGTQSSDVAHTCTKCGADLSEVSTVAVARKNIQDNPRASMIKIQVNDDSCPVCRELKGAYPKDSVPALPAEGCTHHQGCRCFYDPVLEEVYP